MVFVVWGELPWIPSREEALLNPSVATFVAANTRERCDLGAHDERSAWLAAQKTLKRNPADRVCLEELRVEYQRKLAGPMRF